MPLPTFTPEQRAENLRRAIASRQERAKLLDQVRSGEIAFSDALADDRFAPVNVRTLLLAVPGIGQAKANAIMEDAGVPANRRIRGLGHRQAERIAAAVARACE